MLDIKFIRENPDMVKHACAVKNFPDIVDELLALDVRVRELKTITQDEKIRNEALKELSNILGGKKVNRMETFDNSHLFGTYYVAGMVVFEDFLPLRNEYRKYKIDVNTKDDLKAMEEVIYIEDIIDF